MPIEAELRRRLPDGSLIDWALRDAGGADDLPTDPVSDVVARSRLQTIADLLAETLSVSGTVELANPPSDPETGLAKEATLAQVRDRAAFPLPASQVDALKTVTVSNPTPAPETGLAKEVTVQSLATQATLQQVVNKLNDIFGAVDGLEITAGNIDISNTTLNLALDEVEALLRQVRDRADFPLPQSQVTDLKTITVSNPTADPETGLAKDSTLAQVRDRTSFPLPASQVADLKTVAVSNPTANPETGLAKDARLIEVRDALQTLRDNQLRRNDPLPAGTNMLGRVLTTLEAVNLLHLASAARNQNGTAGPFATSELSRLAFDANVSAVSGIGPSMTLFIERQGLDGVWYPLYTSPAITALRTVSTSIGAGMTIAQSLGSSLRLRWEISGTNPSFTFSASMVAK